MFHFDLLLITIEISVNKRNKIPLKIYSPFLGLWVGWPGLDVNDMVFENVPESDPDDTSPTAGLK